MSTGGPMLKKCPRCTFGQLVVRINAHDRSRFLGCSDYPRCTHSEPLPAYIEMRQAGAQELPGLDAP